MMRKIDSIKKYRLVYVGGAVDHIILPIITELYNIYNDQFLFVSTYEKAGLRTGIGYDYSKNKFSFVKKSYISKNAFNECRQIINNADVVIYQNVKDRKIIRKRLFSSKVTFKCTERFYKTKTTIKNFPRRFLGTIYHYHLFNKKNKFVLCMGGYTAIDLKKAHLFKEKMLTWGYFTDTTKLQFADLSTLKKKNDKPLFCWVGRFVKEKQPLMVIKLGEFLRDKGLDFKIKMGGYGPLKDECKKYIELNNLTDYIEILGSLTLDEKEKLMNQSNYHLFTSTNEEGWGAVVNEAMGSACVCFATKESGSPKTLINDRQNGYLFSCHNQDQLNKMVYDELCSPNKTISKNAYDSILNYWNSKTAAIKLSKFIENYLNKNIIEFEEFGPCAKSN